MVEFYAFYGPYHIFTEKAVNSSRNRIPSGTALCLAAVRAVVRERLGGIVMVIERKAPEGYDHAAAVLGLN